MDKRRSLLVAALVAFFLVTGTSAHAQVDPDVVPPSAPTNLTATANNANQVLLVWTASTDNVGVAGYYIYRNGGMVANTGSATYIDLPTAGAYSYTVAAYDGAGNVSVQSAQTAFISIIPDTTPPSAPGNFKAAVSSTSITLSWDIASDNMAIGGYNLYRDGVQLNSSPVKDTSYVDVSSFVSDRNYVYSIRAFDTSGNISNSTSVSVRYDVTAPQPPPGLGAPYISTSTIVLTWQPGSDNIMLVGYYLYRNSAQIAITSSTTYTDMNLATGTAYTYTLNSYDEDGNISLPTAITVTTLVVAAAAPARTNYAPINVLPTVIPPVSSSNVAGATGGTNAGMVAAAVGNTIVFIRPLRVGIQSNDVKNLQTLLIKGGYLSGTYGTGYFGTLTLKALQSFQCKQGIVCSGGPLTTGWGAVGPKTKKALNAI